MRTWVCVARRATRMATLWVTVAASASACQKASEKPPTDHAGASTSAAGGDGKAEDARAGGSPSAPDASSSAPKSPEATRGPLVLLDDKGLTVDGASFPGNPSEWQDRIGAAFAGIAELPGATAVVNVLRDTKAPRVEALIAALALAKAKRVVIRTPRRDLSTGEVELSLAHAPRPSCSVVALIEKDGAVAVWSKAGGTAERYTRGMAGPDLSSSTEALRKRAAGCDSPAWFLGAADAIPWGLAFDLATRAAGGPDAGATLRPKELVFLVHPPTAGRRVTED